MMVEHLEPAVALTQNCHLENLLRPYKSLQNRHLHIDLSNHHSGAMPLDISACFIVLYVLITIPNDKSGFNYNANFLLFTTEKFTERMVLQWTKSKTSLIDFLTVKMLLIFII